MAEEGPRPREVASRLALRRAPLADGMTVYRAKSTCAGTRRVGLYPHHRIGSNEGDGFELIRAREQRTSQLERSTHLAGWTTDKPLTDSAIGVVCSVGIEWDDARDQINHRNTVCHSRRFGACSNRAQNISRSSTVSIPISKIDSSP